MVDIKNGKKLISLASLFDTSTLVNEIQLHNFGNYGNIPPYPWQLL